MRTREVNHLNSPLVKCACGCGELIHSINIHGDTARFKNHHNMGKKEKSPAWKGGQYIDDSGYRLVAKHDHPNSSQIGYIREHRLVMEKHIGRYLKQDEEVHHINGNKLDNRIENLKLMTHVEHSRLHFFNRCWTYNRHIGRWQLKKGLKFLNRK